ncbi:chorismate mutase [Mesorhizobium sp. BR1-1-16]|uniref:chorismate mutase n=1 Tax=Mesorhizobium sp. BR1-1-16 TaxID=2876653 RepID=UPI001CCF401C|nr:chorismate mutase [Mesorhizobium sp. BR1-1-16]MBZ9937911.1 chorismate mutase [Mesorhizobium sp. BR1-1-16]HWJ73695.1 chorismate mutase [Kaistia sp.]
MSKAPEDCETKEDIRAEIDRLDGALIGLLASRFGYVRRMAELKASPDEALVPARVDEVLAHVAARAGAAGLDPDLARALWSKLIDWNIAFERDAIAKRTGEGTGGN